jgi:hypothetical protein
MYGGRLTQEVSRVRKLLARTAVFSCCAATAAGVAVAAPPAPSEPLVAAPLLDGPPMERQALHREAHRKLSAARDRAKVMARPKLPEVALPPQLEAIAACESGGNPRSIGGGGQFRGKYQFTHGTWAGVGGTGDPAAAPEREQDLRAAMLLRTSGPGQWPACGR